MRQLRSANFREMPVILGASIQSDICLDIHIFLLNTSLPNMCEIDIRLRGTVDGAGDCDAETHMCIKIF